MELFSSPSGRAIFLYKEGLLSQVLSLPLSTISCRFWWGGQTGYADQFSTSLISQLNESGEVLPKLQKIFFKLEQKQATGDQVLQVKELFYLS